MPNSGEPTGPTGIVATMVFAGSTTEIVGEVDEPMWVTYMS
ncbi:MAG: hypothetical protein ACREBI_04295 [Nitrosotalea sp.]